MIITRTPLRISFFGGSTDFPLYYNNNEGEVLVTSINKYSYIYIKELYNYLYPYKYRIIYSKIENINTMYEIEHPSVRECLKYINNNKNLEIFYTGDLPARTGMGSSSSFTVGLINGLYSLNDIKKSKYEIGMDAIHIEQNLIKENVGSQDQLSTTIGGFNHITFNKNNIIVKQLILPEKRKNELKKNLLLFYTNDNRLSSSILEEQVIKTKNGQNDNILKNMKNLVKKSIDILLSDKDLDDFGELMNINWELKKQLSSKISNDKIDNIYKTAISNGAIGGKLLGAGYGGFMLFYVPHNKQYDVINNIKLNNINFDFEDQGSVIIYSN